MPKTVKTSKTKARKANARRPAAALNWSRTRKDSKTSGATQSGSKLEQIVTMLRRPTGATIERLVVTTGWQAHSVRGAISGSLKKKLGLAIESEKADGLRVYRIVAA